MNLQEIRAQFPQYADMSDVELARALHSAFYSDMEFGDFAERIGLNLGVPEGLQDVAGSSLSPGVGGAVDFAKAVALPFLASQPTRPGSAGATAELLKLFNRDPEGGSREATLAGMAVPLAPAVAQSATTAAPLAASILRNRMAQTLGGGAIGGALIQRLLGGN